MINLSLGKPHFWQLMPDGTKAEIPVELGAWNAPDINPGMTIGSHSEVGFEVLTKRNHNPISDPSAKIIMEVEVRFVLGDVIDAEREGKKITRWGYLNGSEYSVPLKLTEAERLFW